MKQSKLAINKRFVIDREFSTITDMQTGVVTRLELRLLLLIAMLAAQPQQVVAREQLIKDIWDNYGGAEEGLNQAISLLRKIIHDIDKTIIATVPKKGYVLNAAVTHNMPAVQTAKWMYLLAGLFLLLSIIAFTIYSGPTKQPVLMEPAGAGVDTAYAKRELDSIRKAEAAKAKKQ